VERDESLAEEEMYAERRNETLVHISFVFAAARTVHRKANPPIRLLASTLRLWYSHLEHIFIIFTFFFHFTSVHNQLMQGPTVQL